MKNNATIKGIKISLNLNIAEISFKEEYSRQQDNDLKRNFKHNKASDIKLSLNSEIDEITIEELEELVKEVKNEVVKNIKEQTEAVELSDDKLKFCEDYLRGNTKPKSDREYRTLLSIYFGYSTEELNNLQHSPEALLKREAKNYLVKRIRAAK